MQTDLTKNLNIENDLGSLANLISNEIYNRNFQQWSINPLNNSLRLFQSPKDCNSSMPCHRLEFVISKVHELFQINAKFAIPENDSGCTVHDERESFGSIVSDWREKQKHQASSGEERVSKFFKHMDEVAGALIENTYKDEW